MNMITLSSWPSIVIRGIVLLGVAHRAYTRKTLTPLGVEVALMTGFFHSLPPTNLYLTLLVVFYLTSSKATKYKEEIKSKKTKTPGSDHEATELTQRTHVQVLANSAVATTLIIVSLFVTDPVLDDMLKAGVVGQYCAVIADTWSSELGILSKSSPFLITTLQRVPPGTNGGVTLFGLVAGTTGSALISFVSMFTFKENRVGKFVFFTLIGLLGTLVDSMLGALFQRSVVDKDDGLVLEPLGGARVDEGVLQEMEGHIQVVSGEDMFSNNDVNIVMSVFTTMWCIGLYALLF